MVPIWHLSEVISELLICLDLLNFQLMSCMTCLHHSLLCNPNAKETLFLMLYLDWLCLLVPTSMSWKWTYIILPNSYILPGNKNMIWLGWAQRLPVTFIKDIISASNHDKQPKDFMFLKTNPYNGTSEDLYGEIVRYCMIVDSPSLKKKNDSKNDIILYTCTDMMWPFQVKVVWTHIWE